MVDEWLGQVISDGICTRGRSYRAIRPSGILPDLQKEGRSLLEVMQICLGGAHLSLPTFKFMLFSLAEVPINLPSSPAFQNFSGSFQCHVIVAITCLEC
jgi:hypothetical protein